MLSFGKKNNKKENAGQANLNVGDYYFPFVKAKKNVIRANKMWSAQKIGTAK